MRTFGYWIAFLKASSDLIMTTLAFWLAYYLRFHWLVGIFPLYYGRPSLHNYVLLFFMILLVWPLAFQLTRAYRIRAGQTVEEEFYRILSGIALASAMVWSLALYYRVFHQRGVPSQEWLEPSRLMFLFFMGLDVITVTSGRSLVRWVAEKLRARGWHIRRALVVGAGALGRGLVERMRKRPDMGIQFVGFVDDQNGEPFKGIPVLGKVSDLPKIVDQHQIDTVFIAQPLQAYPHLVQMLDQLHAYPLDIKIAFDVLSHNYLRVMLTDMDGIPLIGVNETPMDGPGMVMKRLFDVVFAALALILCAPLMALLALAIKLTSRGPIIYRQIRMGLDGRPFIMYKFRTMVCDAESRSGPIMAKPNDRRMTTVGRIMRKFSLDELPQFWNVLMGDMSLVGPRPERPHFVAEFSKRYPHYLLRHRAKGGITGWAQVNGLRGAISNLEKRIEYDIYYLTHWSFWLDLAIVLMTPFRMFRYKGI